MDAAESRVWFIGDLDDPWVVAIAEALPGSAGIHRLQCAGDLPECPFDRARPPRVVILHRHRLTAQDAERLGEWRGASRERPSPALILCVSPYIRYEELERWGRLVDLVVSEATAADVLPRPLARLLDGGERRSPAGDPPAFRIEVAAGDAELGLTILEACGAAGYRVQALDDREVGESPRSRDPAASPTPRILTIWEVPVLEPDWAERLGRRSLQTGPVIALAGFADRALVARAKASGAVACLELPCPIEDLLDVIDRTVRSTPPESWPLPARIEPPHTLPPPPRRRNVGQPPTSAGCSPRAAGPHVPPSPWPDRGPLPRIPQ